MKFNFVKERKYHGKLKFARMKDIANGYALRCYNSDMGELIDPILIIAQQNDLQIKLITKIEQGSKMLYLEYENDDIVKAIHILNVCTTLN